MTGDTHLWVKNSIALQTIVFPSITWMYQNNLTKGPGASRGMGMKTISFPLEIQYRDSPDLRCPKGNEGVRLGARTLGFMGHSLF